METIEKTLKPVCIKSDPIQLAHLQATLLHAVGLLNKCRLASVSIGLPDPKIEDLLISTAEFERRTKEYIYQNSTAKDLPLSKELVLANITLPEGYRVAYKAFENLNHYRKQNQQKTDVFDASFYELSEDGVTLVPDYKQRLELLTGDYLNKPDQIEIYETVVRIRQELTDLQKKFPGIQIVGECDSYAALRVMRFGTEIELNTDPIRSLRAS